MTAPVDQAAAQQYRAEQIAAAVAVVAAVHQAASLAGLSLANFTVWQKLIRLLFPLVSAQRQKSAWSAREFFDRERARITGLPRLDVPLVGYDFARFERAMRPAYDIAVKQLAVARELDKQGLPAPRTYVPSTISVLATREVSMGGREQGMAHLEADVQQAENLRAAKRESKRAKGELERGITASGDYPKVVGWARVATGRETCAWCLMLVSRGATYMFADKAAGWQNERNPGLMPYAELNLQNAYDPVKDKSVAEQFAAMEKFLPDIQKRYHPGCDCMVVPVYDKSNWPGRQDAIDARQLWKDALKGFKYDPEKEYRVEQLASGKWKTDTHIPEWEAKQRYALNRIRQHYAGKINLQA